MKKIILGIVLLLGVLCIYTKEIVAQKENAWTFIGGGVVMNIKDTNKVDISYVDMGIYFRSSAISDEKGNLLCYLNGRIDKNYCDKKSDNYGAFLMNRFGDTIPGSKGLFMGCNISNSFFIPVPNHKLQYYLFTQSLYVSTDSFSESSGDVYYHVVDFSTTLKGEVIRKNILLAKKLSWNVSAVKQSNGVDWWIIGFDQINKRVFKFFQLNSDGIKHSHDQRFNFLHGAVFDYINISNNGAKLVIQELGYPFGFFYLFDIDRCNGRLSNPINLNNFSNPKNSLTYGGAVFTKNSRYLFYGFQESIKQNDTVLNSISIVRRKIEPIDSIGIVDTVVTYKFLDDDDNRYLNPMFIYGLGDEIYFGNCNSDERFSLKSNNYISKIENTEGVNIKHIPYAIYHEKRCNCYFPNVPNYNLGPLTINQIGNAYEAETIRICKNRTVLLGDLPEHKRVNYEWSPSEYLSITTRAQPIFTPPGIGTYTYTLKVKADSINTCWPGETYTDKVTIIVTNDSTDCHITDRNKTMKKEIDVQMYPNPAQDFVKVIFEGTSNEQLNVEIFDSKGNRIHTQTIKLGETEINTSSYTTGAYVFKFTDEKGEMVVHKLLIHR